MTNTLENVDRTRTLLKYNKSPEARKPIIEKGSYSSVRVVPNGSFDVSRTELLMNIVRARTAFGWDLVADIPFEYPSCCCMPRITVPLLFQTVSNAKPDTR